jgi:hypothetical protein
MRLTKSTLTTARVHPALRCVCGHVVSGHDLDLDGMNVRLICTRCHQSLLEIRVSVWEYNHDGRDALKI